MHRRTGASLHPQSAPQDAGPRRRRRDGIGGTDLALHIVYVKAGVRGTVVGSEKTHPDILTGIVYRIVTVSLHEGNKIYPHGRGLAREPLFLDVLAVSDQYGFRQCNSAAAVQNLQVKRVGRLVQAKAGLNTVVAPRAAVVTHAHVPAIVGVEQVPIAGDIGAIATGNLAAVAAAGVAVGSGAVANLNPEMRLRVAVRVVVSRPGKLWIGSVKRRAGGRRYVDGLIGRVVEPVAKVNVQEFLARVQDDAAWRMSG